MSPTLRRFLPLLLTLLVLSPALFTAHLVWTKAVDVGVWDMWEDGPLLEKWHDGTLTWRDLYAAQIQHRIVVPRLLIIAMAELSGGDFRWQQYACFLLIATDALLVWLMLKRTLGLSPWRWPLMFAFNLLLFCPVHYQQLFWGCSMWSLIPMPCLLAAVLVLTPRDGAGGTWWRFAAAVLLAEVATHSFAHGLAIWPLILGLMLINPALGTLKHRLILTGVGTVIAAVTIACYFTDFVNMAHHAYHLRPGDHAMTPDKNHLNGASLSEHIRFFFAFLGTWFARTPFIDRPVNAAVFLGQITFLFLGVVVIFILRNRLWRSTLPWLALAAYVALVGVMVSKRGADAGDHRAVTPRYLALSQHLLIASIAMTATLGAVFRRANQRWREHHPEDAAAASPNQVARTTGVILLTAFCTAQIPVWQYGRHLTEVWHHARRQGQALLLFLPHLKEQGRLISMDTLDKKAAHWDCYDDSVSKLIRINRLRTRPLDTPELTWFAEDKPLPGSKAEVTEAAIQADGTLALQGHARFNAGEPADAILIVQNGRVISLGQPAPRHILRVYGLDYEFANVTDVQVPEMYPWQAHLKLPTLDAPLELWALDVMQRRISRLGGTITFNSANRTAEIQTH